MTEPLGNITDETLVDIATNGMWAGGLTFSPAALRLAQTLLAAVQGTAEGLLPEELQQQVSVVRAVAAFGFPRIVTSDGVALSAFTITLNTSTPAPVVVVPAGWSPYGWLPFIWTYLTLAADGYHVLAYTPRGLGHPGWVSTSEGYIDVGGPKDWCDGSDVLDYATELFTPSSIGLLGESYGSGISQLIAAHDPANRVAAVVALSTWGNLATSMYDHGTRHLEAVKLLVEFTGGERDDKFDAATLQILDDFEDGRNLDDVVAWATERSPETYLDATNARGIPTFVSNTWHESLFPANQVVDTFTGLTVPKRLNMWIGDHGAPESAGLIGVPLGIPFPGLQVPMREARDWLKFYLHGADVADQVEVSNQIMFTYQTVQIPGGSRLITVPARRENHSSWDDVGTGTERWYLGDGTPDGVLDTRPKTGWARGFTAGELTGATAMDKVLTTGQQEWFGNPKVYRLDEFERDRLLIWQTEPLTGRRLRGAPTVRLTVRNTAGAATLVAYLFDIGPDADTRIITHEPCTIESLPPGQDRTIDWRLQAGCYDIPDGHRLALVINSRDQLYAFTGAIGSTTTISSPTGSESYLDLVLG